MRKTFKAMVMAVLLVGCTALLAGCSRGMTAQGATAYVKSVLDASYKGEFDQYLKITDSTKEEAETMYEDGMNTVVESFKIEGYDIPEELVDKYYELSVELYKSAKYEVGEAKKYDDGYIVEVSVSPFTLMETFEDDFYAKVMADMDTLNNMETEEEYASYIYQAMYDVLKEKVDSLEYKDAVTVKVEVFLDTDEKYNISEDDLYDVEEALFPYSY